MDRNALLVYLHDLRDLEVAKYQIEKKLRKFISLKNTVVQNLQNQIEMVKKENYWERPEQPEKIFLFMFGCGVFLIFGGFFFKWLGIPLLDKICMVIGVICSIMFGWLHFSEYREYRNAVREVEQHNQQEMERLTNVVPGIVKEKRKIQQKNMSGNLPTEQHLKEELEKVKTLLQEAYALNILASAYRNVASVYYIYEYMSTSQASLEETLIHEHMENGIKRIESKLDMIIEQNEELIFSMRQVEANTERTVEQTKEMLSVLQKNLESQQRTEQSTLEATQYAAISANYSKTTAFFAMADYLGKGNHM